MAEIGRGYAPRGPERELGAREITADVLDRVFPIGPRFWPTMLVLGLVFLAGLVAFVLRLMAVGLEARPAWGYLAATVAFLISTVQTAPLFAIGVRWTKADWLRPLARTCQLFTVPGVLSLLLFLPLVATLPPLADRRSLWINWPLGAPGYYDTLALLAVVLTGLGLLYLAAIPDLAAARDHPGGSRRSLYARLAANWRGTGRQWAVLRFALVLLGAFYAMLLAYVHLLLPYDFAMSLVPHWNSSVLPAYHMTTALQGAVAASVVALFLWRRFGGLDGYIRRDVFPASGTILFALSLLSFYLWWSDFLVLWYGRTPPEQMLLRLLAFDVYLMPWALAFSLSILVPFLALLWGRVRHSVLGTALASLSVLAGIFFDRVRLYASAYSVEETAVLERLPQARPPDLLDLLMMAGTMAGVVLLYLAAAKLVPPLALWEVKEDLLLRLRRPFLRGEYVVLGKPR